MNSVRPKDWREVASLSEAAQRDLLASGDPAERVWSIWALGLRLGRGAFGDFHKDLDLETLPGIRCQLIVVLAGLGEANLVRAAALDDPDPVVRAVACQYVVRTLPTGSDVARDFAIERMRHDVPRVQHAMFEEVQSDRLRLPDGVLLKFLTHPDLETRRLSLESLAAFNRASDEVVRRVADRVLVESDPVLRGACIEFYLRYGVAASLVGLTSVARAPLVCEVLSALQRSGIRLKWAELSFLASRSDPDISLAILESLVEPLEPDAIGWMSNLAAASLAIPKIRSAGSSPLLTFQWRALAMLYKVVAPETLQFFDLSVAQALLDWLRAEDEYDDEDVGEGSQDLVKRELLANHVASSST